MSNQAELPYSFGTGHIYYQLSEGRGELKMLPIDQVLCDPAIQPRERLNQSVVRDYLRLIRSNEGFPALQVAVAGERLLLIDGYHRYAAAKLAKQKVVRCVVHDGDRRQAILLSASANIRNGLRRTNADKARAVMKLLADPEWRQWSDREIARYCSVSQPFVGRMRSKARTLTDNVISENSDPGENRQRRFVTRHGTPAVMHLPARQRSSSISSQRILPLTNNGENGEAQTVLALEDMENARARFIEAILACENVIRSIDIAVIRTDPAADDALYRRLTELAQLIKSYADKIAAWEDSPP